MTPATQERKPVYKNPKDRPKNDQEQKTKKADPPDITLVLLDPDEILADQAFNGRYGEHNPKAVAEMVKSFKEVGQVHPVRVQPKGKDGKYRLVSGFLRHAASLKMPKSFKLRAEVAAATDAEAFRVNVSENAMRRSTTPADDAVNVGRLRKARVTFKEIGKIYGKSEAWAKQTATLLKLDASVLDRLASGDITRASALDLATRPAERQQEILKEAKTTGGKIDTAKVSEAIREEAQEKSQSPEPSRVATKRRSLADLKKALGVFEAYTYESPAVEQRVKSLVGKLDEFLKGKGSQQSLIKAVESACGVN